MATRAVATAAVAVLLLLLLLLLQLSAAAAAARGGALSALPPLGARGAVSVSGVSSGAYAAVQFHVAFSSSVVGAGVIAGGPYWCAQDNVELALNSCMKYPDLISVTELIGITYSTGLSLTIDSPSNLASSRVWLFSGTKDTVVNPGVVQRLREYYSHFLPASSVHVEFDTPAEHAMITDSYGSDCGFLGTPFINNCGLDAAGEILAFIYGNLTAPVAALDDNLFWFDQEPYTVLGLTATSFGSQGAVYVPSGCQHAEGCRVHVAFHGCEQTVKEVGDEYVTRAGYNGWAEANNIVVLYPQAESTVVNPKGCFDWWGYTGPQYASKLGLQNAAVHDMIKAIAESR